MYPSLREFLSANRVPLLLAALALAGASCRLYGLDKQSLEPDELYTIPASLGRHYRYQSDFRPPPRPVSIGVYRGLLTPEPDGRGLRDVTDVLRRNVHAPLYFYFMHYWVGWFGTSESALRLPSALFGVAAIFVIFLLGRELFDDFAGLFAAALLALVPEQVYNSTNARMYSLLVLLALCSTYLMVRLLKGRAARRRYLLYGLVSLAGLYTHYVYLFCLAFQTLYVWSRFRGRREIRLPWLATQAGVGALFAPWLLVGWSQKQTADEALSWVSGGLAAGELFQVLLSKVAALTSAPEAPLGRLWQLVALILILLGARALVAARSELLLLALWVAVPLAGILLADALGGTKAVTATRYWMVFSPAFYLLMAAGARRACEALGGVWPAAALVVLLGVAGAWAAAGRLRQRSYDIEGLVRYVESQVGDAGRELVLAEGPAALPLALAYYGRRDLRVWRLNFGLGEPSEEEFVRVMRERAGEGEVVWLLSFQLDEAGEALEAVGFRRDDSRSRPGIQNVHRYVRP